MEYGYLGRTEIRVSKIGFGTFPIGGRLRPGDYGVVDDGESVEAIRFAFDRGVTLFDTAPTYGGGHAEELLAKALGNHIHEVVTVTKCGAYWNEDEARWDANSSREAISERVESSLRKLNTDAIDLLLVHIPDRSRPADEVMDALKAMQASGKVRDVGVSNFSLEELREYLRFGRLVAHQVGYHMFDRRMEKRMLHACSELGVGVMAYGSLGFGLLSGTWTAATKFDAIDWRSTGEAFGLPIFKDDNLPRNIEVVERLSEYARGLGKTMPQLAIAWVLHRPEVSVALVGARSPAEVEENLGAVGWRLSEDDVAAIDRILSEAVGTSPDAPEFRG